MKKEIAQKWVKALKSGKYEQTQLALRNNSGFCCLGVLCDLYAKEHPEVRWINNRFMGIVGSLPSRVQDWAGIKSSEGRLYTGPNVSDRVTYLSALNDREGEDFYQIAQVIDAVWEQL